MQEGRACWNKGVLAAAAAVRVLMYYTHKQQQKQCSARSPRREPRDESLKVLASPQQMGEWVATCTAALHSVSENQHLIPLTRVSGVCWGC